MTNITEEKNGDPKPPKAEVAVVTRTPDAKYDRFARLGQWLAAAEGSKDPRGADGMAAAYRIAAADELGLSPLAAGELFVQNGRLRVQALLLRAIAEGRGYKVEPKEQPLSPTSCTAVLSRDGVVVGESTFTIDDAKAADLLKKDNYQRYPARMLWARASTNVIRDYAPSVAVGIVTDEEIDANQADYDGPLQHDLELDANEQYDAEQAEVDRIAAEQAALDEAAAVNAAAEGDDTRSGRQVKDEVGQA